MSRSPRRIVPVAVGLALALTASSCSGGGKHAGPGTTGGPTGTGTSPTTTPPAGDPGAGPGGGKVRTGAGGKLALLLSKGQPLTALAATPVKLVTGTDLGADGVAPIVGRLTPWVDDASLATGFRWPTQSSPVPRAGATVAPAFPPATSGPPAPAPATGPLTVARVQPSGDVPIAPFVTVSFSRPMVPVATVDQVEALAVPATITPAIAGHWRWLGTQTLRFDADKAAVGADRLPMATEYTVTIPAGTTSATGGTLAEASTFTFRTPPVTVQSSQPADQQTLPLDPVLVLAYDQRVDPAEVVKHLGLTAGGDARTVRLATADEVAARGAAAGKLAPGTVPVSTDGLVDGRWMAVTPDEPLPADAAIELTVGKGTPSAEGPRVTEGATTFRWRTYAPLRVTDVSCGQPSPCPPTGSITVQFDNELDTARFDPATVTVRPELAQRSVSVYGNVVQITGITAPRTTYEVTLPAGLTDVYGQTLGKDVKEKVSFGPSRPILEQFTSPLITIDPLAGAPSLTIGTVNHDKVHLHLFAVTAADWATYQGYLVELQQQQTPGGSLPALPAWRSVADRIVAIDNKDDVRVETRVDLAGALGGDGLGHVVALVEPTETYDPNDQDYWQNRPTLAWLQATKIGVDAFADNDELRVWTTDLATGAPRPGVAVAMLGPGASPVGAPATTGDDGVARLTPPPADPSSGSPGATALQATDGADVALLPNGGYPGNGWSSNPVADDARWFVVDDRHTYRPGETVSVKGFVRRFEASGDGQLHVVSSGSVHYTAFDAQGIAIGEGTATLTPLGGFDFTLVVPAAANQGPANVALNGEGFAGVPFTGSGYSFDVQEFRRPDYEVVTRVEGADPVVSSRPATVAVDANYYTGGAVGSAPVTWTVTTTNASYAPPGWNGFSFGEWTPWWSDVFAGSGPGFSGPYGTPFGDVSINPRFGGNPNEVKTYTGTTGADGSHYLQVGFRGADGVLPDLPKMVRAQAAVQDVNRQVLASTTDVLVHPADVYVGLRGKQTFVKEGDPIDVDAIVTTIDGKAAAGRAFRVTASRSEWTVKDGQWVETQADLQTCEKTSSTDPVPCSFTAATGGQYTISATVDDDHGATSRTTLTRWVSGGLGRPDRTVGREQLTVVPAKDGYGPGDTAEVLVQAPFAAGHGIVTVSRVGIDRTIAFDVADGTAVVRVPLADADVPGLSLSFEVAGTTTRTGDDGRPLDGAPARPAFAVGSLALRVSTASRSLKVTAVPRATTLAPGHATTIDVSATGPDGAPAAGAELAVAVVDEAVLALGPYRWTDPLAVFYAPPFNPVQSTFGRESITLVSPQEALTPTSGVGQAAGGAATTAAAAATSAVRGPAPAAADATAKSGAESFATAGNTAVPGGATAAAIDTRTNFDALAVFRPTVLTGVDGTASVDVTLPDNLTRYRVMVVAVQGDDRFGAGDAEITARKPLMLRPSAPRFLNFGDVFELPVVVQNQTDQTMTVDVALQLSNLAATGAPGKRVDVPANDRVEVRFPVSAVAAGTGRFRVAAVSGDAFSDAVTVDVPVYTPVTQEAFATYGTVDGGGADGGVTAQPLLAPTGVLGGFGGLDVTTSSTALQGLTDALLDVTRWEFDSVDARASRILAITSLRPVLSAFSSPDLPSEAVLDASIRDDIDGIASRQNGDGGFGFWSVNRPSDPYASVEATHALVAARAAGFAVPPGTLAQALSYLTNIEQYAEKHSSSVGVTLSAYALRVRALAGDRDVAKAEQLWRSNGGDLPVDALAWLWPVVDDPSVTADIARRVANAAVETAGAVTFTTNYGDDAYVILASNRRTDAVVLGALIAEQPDSTLIPKIVTGLLSHRDGGHWRSIQEDSFVLQALKTYFDTYERQTPAFVARVWLGDRYAGEQSFAGRSTDRLDVRVPTSELVATGNTTLTVSKEGTGRLYYRIGMTYAPSSLQSEARDRGFVVQRTYEALDDPADVRRVDNGAWHVKAGARVRVRLTMVAESQRTHVALIDPLPAGLEIANPALATTPDAPPTNPGGFPVDGPAATVAPRAAPSIIGPAWWYPTWFEHQNLKDDRAEAFANFLPAGSYEYTYDARATTPGTFVVPPTRAEQIYEPESFGRSASTTVVVDA